MNTDIRLKIGFLDNTKVVKLQRRHGDGAVLGLIRFWSYVAENKPTGILDGLDSEDIDIACGQHTFSMHDALLDLGFLHQSENGYTVHDWEENQPWAFNAADRSKIARDAARARWDKKKPVVKQPVKSNAQRMPNACTADASSNAPILSSPILTLPKPSCQKNKFSDDDMKAAEYMFSLIQQLNPNHKAPDLNIWANTIRLMVERDNRTHRDICKVYKWVNSDEFWQTNCLSPTTLRTHFDKLYMKMKPLSLVDQPAQSRGDA